MHKLCWQKPHSWILSLLISSLTHGTRQAENIPPALAFSFEADFYLIQCPRWYQIYDSPASAFLSFGTTGVCRVVLLALTVLFLITKFESNVNTII